MLHGYGQLLVNVKLENIYADLAEDVEEKFETSNYEVERPLFRGKNKKAIELI